jgi:hypothetical protein
MGMVQGNHAGREPLDMIAPVDGPSTQRLPSGREGKPMEWTISSNPEREVWRRILEYTNQEFAFDTIQRRHGKATNKREEQNYHKQCAQLRAAILQAREFFAATAASTLYTNPNHLYYGAVSLATATMLLNGTGDQALDVLRNDDRNRSHGLKFSLGNPSPKSLLESCGIRVQRNGHFANWYNTLPLGIVGWAEKCERFPEESRSSTGLDRFCERPRASLATLESARTSLLDLLRILPDLNNELRRYRMGVPSSRSTLLFTIVGEQITIQYSIHGARTPDELQTILEEFRFRGNCLDVDQIDCVESDRMAIVTIRGPNKPDRYTFPEHRTTLYHEDFVYAAELPTPEFADAYRVSFGLSMLCRYYPDVWTRCLESQCIAAKLVERFVTVYADKFPLLALRLLADNLVVISQHRPWWH